MVRRGLGGRACARTHESGRAPRRRLVPQPAPPCRGPYAGVQHRHRLRALGVGYSLAPSPTAPSPAASRRAKRSRLRHRWPPPRFPAPPPGGLRLAPWPDARPCADGALRHGAATAQAVAAPPAHRSRRRRRSVLSHQCVSCVRVCCLSPVEWWSPHVVVLCAVSCRVSCVDCRLSPCARGDRTCNSGRPAHF